MHQHMHGIQWERYTRMLQGRNIPVTIHKVVKIRFQEESLLSCMHGHTLRFHAKNCIGGHVHIAANYL